MEIIVNATNTTNQQSNVQQQQAKVQLPDFFTSAGLAVVAPVKLTGVGLSLAVQFAEELVQVTPALSKGMEKGTQMLSFGIAKVSAKADVYMKKEGWDNTKSFDENYAALLAKEEQEQVK